MNRIPGMNAQRASLHVRHLLRHHFGADFTKTPKYADVAAAIRDLVLMAAREGMKRDPIIQPTRREVARGQ